MKETNDALTIRLRPGHMTKSLAVIVAILGLANIPVTMMEQRWKIASWTVSDFFRCFTLDSENSLPAWFSTWLLLYCALLIGIVARTARVEGDRWWRYWAALGVLFVGLSIDEMVGFHEMLILPLRNRFGTGGLLWFAWVIPGAAFVLTVGLIFGRFVFQQNRRVRNGIILSGFIYVGGAIGCEMPGGLLMERYGETSVAYTAMATIEECLEMIGLIVFSHTLLTLLTARVGEIRVTTSAHTVDNSAAIDSAPAIESPAARPGRSSPPPVVAPAV